MEDETGELAGRLGSEWLVDMAGNGSDSDQGGRQARKGRRTEGGQGGVSSGACSSVRPSSRVIDNRSQHSADDAKGWIWITNDARGMLSTKTKCE